MKNSVLIDDWINYFILDSILFNIKTDYVINDITIYKYAEVLKNKLYINDNGQVTVNGKNYRNQLFKKLRLNKYTAHIYPSIEDLL